jgi:hypothetical protein
MEMVVAIEQPGETSMSKSNQAESGKDIRPLHENEISAVNGGFFMIPVLGGGFVIGALVGYGIADTTVPKYFQDLL